MFLKKRRLLKIEKKIKSLGSAFRYTNLQNVLWPAFSLFILLSLYVIFNADLASSISPAAKTAAAAGLIFLLISIVITYYEYHGFGNNEGIVRRGPVKMKIALTFDDGPSPDYTPRVLDVLKKYEVKATFFLVGRHVEKYPEVAKRILQEGHEIGNHTYSHRDLVPSSKRKLIYEVERCRKTFKDVLGIETYLFRPPRGIYSEAVRQFIVDRGFKMILWSISGIDWAGTPAGVIAKRIIRSAHPGAIILLHDSGALLKSEGHSRMNTVKALELIIPALKEKGFEFVTVSELMRAEKEFDFAELKEVTDLFQSSVR